VKTAKRYIPNEECLLARENQQQVRVSYDLCPNTLRDNQEDSITN